MVAVRGKEGKVFAAGDTVPPAKLHVTDTTAFVNGLIH